MTKSAESYDHSAEPDSGNLVESPMIPGQIEQVVSSADCRSAGRSQTNLRVVHEANQDDGAAGASESEGQSAEPLLTLEDRLLVAFASRGNLRIGQLIVIATGASQPFYVEDRDLVELVERYVFEGIQP